ncbi:hypothetical protein ACJQWK_03540 [Exserohilum turcicum]|uniref:Uncharacterized protein n=1 Tax=Exserohilum turcicum (strain 28A) TaxID=671987 RepID=R0KSW7_EXST2|nr:uncharacterized protein SETTUDRAFT_30535 [Exserohilum turcica Et28A]EOA92054.1 hypothetical protein SETTUDRAFT_30535 [Exserohilum turcica Et28A]
MAHHYNVEGYGFPALQQLGKVVKLPVLDNYEYEDPELDAKRKLSRALIKQQQDQEEQINREKALRESIIELKGSAALVRAGLGSYRALKRSVEDLQTENADLHAQVAAQRTVDLADLEKQLALVASLKNDAEADVADKQHQISTLQGECDSLRTQKAQLEAQIATLTQNAVDIAAQPSSGEATLAAEKVLLETEEHTHILEYIKDRSAWQSEKKELESRLANAAHEHERERSAWEEVKERLDQAQSEERTQHSHDRLRWQAEKAQLEHQATVITDKEEEIADLRSELEDYEAVNQHSELCATGSEWSRRRAITFANSQLNLEPADHEDPRSDDDINQVTGKSIEDTIIHNTANRLELMAATIHARSDQDDASKREQLLLTRERNQLSENLADSNAERDSLKETLAEVLDVLETTLADALSKIAEHESTISRMKSDFAEFASSALAAMEKDLEQDTATWNKIVHEAADKLELASEAIAKREKDVKEMKDFIRENLPKLQARRFS